MCPWNVKFAQELPAGSPFAARAKLWMLERNACVVLGNIGTADDLAVLEAMQGHEHDVVREHAAWAILRIDALNNTGSRMDGVGRSDCGERA